MEWPNSAAEELTRTPRRRRVPTAIAEVADANPEETSPGSPSEDAASSVPEDRPGEKEALHRWRSPGERRCLSPTAQMKRKTRKTGVLYGTHGRLFETADPWKRQVATAARSDVSPWRPEVPRQISIGPPLMDTIRTKPLGRPLNRTGTGPIEPTPQPATDPPSCSLEPNIN